MTFRRLANVAVGFGMLALSIGCLFAMVGLFLAGPATNTLTGAGVLILLGNVTFASVGAGFYLLDSPADRKTFGIRNLTLAGWGLVAVTANVMAGAAWGISCFPEYAPLLASGRIAVFAAVLTGLAVFLVGWFTLSRFGCLVWRKNDASDTPGG